MAKKALKLKMMAGGPGQGCQGKSCPTLFKTNRRTYVVQGYVKQDVLKAIELPNGETAVEISAALVEQIKALG